MWSKFFFLHIHEKLMSIDDSSLQQSNNIGGDYNFLTNKNTLPHKGNAEKPTKKLILQM